MENLNFFERQVFKKFLRPSMKRINKKMSAVIPKFELSSKHVQNARLLPTREELLAHIPQNGVAAELGVDEGGFSEKILTINKPKKLHLIDEWGSKRYNKIKQQKVETKFSSQIAKGEVEINLGLSTDVVSRFDDGYFDWIYIDTAHTYDVTIAELELYQPKVKEGGIIAGHDFIVGNWDGVVRYGVIEAVHEFCTKYDWEIILQTCELYIKPSFALKKIR